MDRTVYNINPTSTQLWLRSTDSHSAIRRKASKIGNRIRRRIFGPLHENDLGWGLRNNEEFYVLSYGPAIVTYIKPTRFQWDGHIVRMDNSRMPEKSTG